MALAVLLATGSALAVASASAPRAPTATGGRLEPLTFRLSPQSRLDVLTKPAGLFGGFGHDHRIRARSFSGTIVYDPANVVASSVEITLQTLDLDVLPIGADREDASKIEEAMREEVLHVDRYPTITFRSTAIAPIEEGVRVTGDLTLRGGSRPVTVDMRLRPGPKRLVATGRFSIKQTDWGIEPYSAALGSIKVADRVTFDIRAIGVRAGG